MKGAMLGGSLPFKFETTAGNLRDLVVHRYALSGTWQRMPLGNYQLKQ